jgi:hypothetical protein
MRILRSLPFLTMVWACGEDTLTVRGSLLPGSAATDVYVVGQPLRAPVESDSFVIGGVPGELAVLEFAEDGNRLGRMRIERWTGSELDLRGIWIDDGIAFASTVEGDGSATVNALRMAPESALPGTLSAAVSVLAVAPEGDALIVRPDDGELPDLRVVLTPGTSIETAGGYPAEVDFRFGDSLRIEGASEGGYVVANTVVVLWAASREEEAPAKDEWMAEAITAAEEDDDDNDDKDEADRDEQREGPRSLQRPGRGKGRGRGLQPRRD